MFQQKSIHFPGLIQMLVTAILFMIIGLLIFPANSARGDANEQDCQCTDYVYRQRKDIPPAMGHARDWVKSASIFGLPYDYVPQPGDAAVILNGEHGFNSEYGHVAIVIGVNREHTRFDIAGYDGTVGNCLIDIYTDLPVTSNTVFIHRVLPVYN
jgi:hypothetical protein